MAFKLIIISILVMVGFMNPESQAKASTQFRYIITETSAPSSLDPLDADNTANLPVARMIYATPLEAAINNQLTSRVLESFRYDTEKKRVEWKVKSGIKYEDGSPITAEDVAFAVARMAYTRPKFPIIEAIEGLGSWVKTADALKKFPKGITVSDNIVRIQFASDVDHPLFRFCLELFSIIPQRCVDPRTNKLICAKIPESGLYKIADQGQKQIKFLKRGDANEQSAPDQISFDYKTPAELVADLTTLDDATVIAGNESFFAPGILHDLEGKLTVKYTPAARFSVLQINQSVGPFKDKKCRQLFSKTFRASYQEIAKDSPAEGSVFTKILPGYLSLKDLETENSLSPSEAQACKAKLAKESFPWGYAEPERDAIFFQALKRTFEILGIKALSPVIKSTRKEFSDLFAEGKVAFFNAGSGFWALDPAGDMKMLLTPNLHKPLKHVSDDEKLQSLIAQLSSSSSTYAKVNRYLFEEARFNVYTHVRRFFCGQEQEPTWGRSLCNYLSGSMASIQGELMSAKAEQFLLSFTAKLKERGRLPKHIEVSSLSSGTMASVFDSAPPSVINESVFCGIDPNPATAILKGLVEMIERQAFSEGYKGGLAHCQTTRSDGFAAFPLGVVPNANGIARENGLSEAIERYVWASWWDDQSIGHEIRPVDFQALSFGESLLRDLRKNLSLDSIAEVSPWMDDNERVVLIYLAFLNPLGVISGGACGKKEDFEGIRYRAISELLRHGLAVTRLNTNPDSEMTFYEKRLRFFGLTKDGTALAQSRLKARGSSTIKLPRLAHDSPVPHSLSKLVAVHRCHFENQPEFVGGELERLCL